MVKATVTNVMSFGAFVRLPDGNQALLHVSEMHAPEGTVAPNSRDLMTLEQELEVKMQNSLRFPSGQTLSSCVALNVQDACLCHILYLDLCVIAAAKCIQIRTPCGPLNYVDFLESTWRIP